MLDEICVFVISTPTNQPALRMRVGQADSQEARVPPAELGEKHGENIGDEDSSDSVFPGHWSSKLTAMISALEMVGAMLLMNREQVLWRGRGLGESSLAFFSSLPLSLGFSSLEDGGERKGLS